MAAKNGMYKTPADNQTWVDAFTQDYVSDAMFEYFTGKSRSDMGPGELELLVKDVTFVVTEKCNLACTYCYETHKTDKRMSKEVAKASVDLLFDQNKVSDYFDIGKVPSIILNFIGGEPLLEIDLIDYIVEYFKYKAIALDHPWQYNYMISLSTNGTMYMQKKVQKFLLRNPHRVSMSISIDGDKELHDACRVYRSGHGSYDVVARSVKKAREDGIIDALTKSTIAPGNIQYMVRAIRHLTEDLGLTGVFENFVYEKGWTIEHARMAYTNLKEMADWLLDSNNQEWFFLSFFDEVIGYPNDMNNNYCGGAGDMIAFGVDGQVSPCLRYLKYALERSPERVIGDVFTGINPKAQDSWLLELDDVTRISQSPPKCIDCPINTGCGGCTAYNYDYSGNPNIKATFICRMHRARVLANAYYWAMTYKKHDLSKRYPINIPIAWALEIIDESEFFTLYDISGADTLEALIDEFMKVSDQ